MDPDISLEEGEIVDNDVVNSYVILERPANYSSLANPRFSEPIDDESEYETSSGSESDSDTELRVGPRTKRLKCKLKPKIKSNVTKKKYDIWSTRIQEDVLLENLVNCDVSQVDRSRSVETYAVNNKLRTVSKNKRKFDQRHDTNLHSNRRNSTEEQKPLTILDLTVTVDDSETDVANDIANKLYETNDELISNVVRVIGNAAALELFKKTKSIEENGGMLIFNQSRRRTPGGVYLQLVKLDGNLTEEQQKEIFNESKIKFKNIMKNKRKIKMRDMKKKIKIAGSNSINKHNLPELLNRSELCANLAEGHRSQRKTEVEDVANPPPSPVTDVHESSDDTDNIKHESNVFTKSASDQPVRNLLSYDDDDFITGDCDMELF